MTDSPEWQPGEDPLDLKFVYRSMKVLPPLPIVAPKPEEQMLVWQQYQRLKFEFKERGLPTDGSYVPPAVTPAESKPTPVKAVQDDKSLFRSSSSPALAKPPLSPAMTKAKTGMHRGVSGSLSNSGGWNRASINQASSGELKSGLSSSPSTPDVRRATIVSEKKLKNVADTFEKARQHLNDGLFDKAILAYTDVICESLLQRVLCLLQQEDFQEAIANCDFVLHFRPDDAKAKIRKAKALASLGKNSEATKLRTEAAPLLKPTDPEVWEVENMLGLNTGVAAPRAGPSGSVFFAAPPTLTAQSPEPERKGKEEAVDDGGDEPAGLEEPSEPQPTSPTATRSSGRGLGRGTPAGRGSPAGTTLKRNLDSAPNKKLPVPPPRTSATISKPKDPLDLSLKYADMEDSQLPPLPSNPPSVEEDLLRWQQYQRLKAEYRDRRLEPRFDV